MLESLIPNNDDKPKFPNATLEGEFLTLNGSKLRFQAVVNDINNLVNSARTRASTSFAGGSRKTMKNKITIRSNYKRTNKRTHKNLIKENS